MAAGRDKRGVGNGCRAGGAGVGRIPVRVWMRLGFAGMMLALLWAACVGIIVLTVVLVVRTAGAQGPADGIPGDMFPLQHHQTAHHPHILLAGTQDPEALPEVLYIYTTGWATDKYWLHLRSPTLADATSVRIDIWFEEVDFHLATADADISQTFTKPWPTVFVVTDDWFASDDYRYLTARVTGINDEGETSLTVIDRTKIGRDPATYPAPISQINVYRNSISTGPHGEALVNLGFDKVNSADPI